MQPNDLNPQERCFLFHVLLSELHSDSEIKAVLIHNDKIDGVYEPVAHAVTTFPYIPQKMVDKGFVVWRAAGMVALTDKGRRAIESLGSSYMHYEEDMLHQIATVIERKAMVPAGLKAGDIVRLEGDNLAYVIRATYFPYRGWSLEVFHLTQHPGQVKIVREALEIMPLTVQPIPMSEQIGWGGYRLTGGWHGSISKDKLGFYDLRHAEPAYAYDIGLSRWKLGVALDLLLVWLMENKGVPTE